MKKPKLGAAFAVLVLTLCGVSVALAAPVRVGTTNSSSDAPLFIAAQ